MPRRYPKSSSVTIDWQATSQLFFLSAKQELLYLSASAEDDEVMSAASLGDLQKVNSFTPFGAMIAKQVQNATAKSTANNSLSIGVPGKSSVQEVRYVFIKDIFCCAVKLENGKQISYEFIFFHPMIVYLGLVCENDGISQKKNSFDLELEAF